jgi:hypothetical protein
MNMAYKNTIFQPILNDGVMEQSMAEEFEINKKPRESPRFSHGEESGNLT